MEAETQTIETLGAGNTPLETLGAGNTPLETLGAGNTPLEALGLIQNKNGGTPKCAENLNRLLQRHPKFKERFRFDEFAQENQIQTESGRWRRVNDDDILQIQSEVQSLYMEFSSYGRDMVTDAINFACSRNPIDSAKEWIKGLEWDGNLRLEQFLQNAYGVEDTLYHQLVGKNFLLGIAARILKPGCDHRSVLVVEGEQNTKKSKAFRALVGADWFNENTPLPSESLSFYMTMWGKLLIEFTEGVVFSKVDMGKLKGIVSTPIDTIVKKWGRNPLDIPRRCVFVISTNETEYFTDRTGNTRFFPVRAQKISVEWIEEYRNQLFAEARTRIEQGEKWWDEEISANEEFQKEQDRRMTTSLIEEKIDSWFENPYNAKGQTINPFETPFLTIDIFGSNRPTRGEMMEAVAILKKRNFVKNDGDTMFGGRRGRFWHFSERK